MMVIRSAIFIGLMMVWTIFYSFICMLVAIMPYRFRYWTTAFWNRVVIFSAKWILGIDYEVKGRENLPPLNAGAVILSKHQSVWETVFLLYALGNPLCFVFKRELLYIPFFGWGIGLLRMVAIDRRSGIDAFSQMLMQAKKRMADGVWMILFPEGTRVVPGALSKYKSGGTRLAIALDVPIVPIAHNAGECWPKKPWWNKHPGKVTVSILPIIHPERRELSVVHGEIVNAIEEEMQRLPKAHV